MADTTPPTAFCLSAEPPVNIQQVIVTKGETLHFNLRNSTGFHHVALAFTKEKQIVLSSEHSNMCTVVRLKNCENLSHILFYFSQPIMLIQSKEVRERLDREISPGFCSRRTTPLTFQQAQVTQNNLQPETLNIKEELTHGHNPPECNSIGEALCKEATIAQSRKIGSGREYHSLDDSEVDLGESSHGWTHNRVHNKEESKEYSGDTNPSVMNSFVSEQKRNQIGMKYYECRDCGELFSLFTQLTKYNKSHTRMESIKCSQCDSAFLCPTNLQLYLRIQTDNKQPICNTCGKCFSSRYNLKRHFTIHTGEKPYECPECKKTFRNSCLLRQHKVIHSEQKEYECNECSKAFHRRAHLTRHKLIHTRGN